MRLLGAVMYFYGCHRLAAEQGYAKAQFDLGVRYAEGEGVTQDFVEAARWYRLAAEQGHSRAQVNLGNLYACGDGVTQDDISAHMWLNLAASRATGKLRTHAAKRRDDLAARMTRADLNEAQRRARRFPTAGGWRSGPGVEGGEE